jgi:uncharacterized BrkB/YihY/UPF0761 family membrane protein
MVAVILPAMSLAVIGRVFPDFFKSLGTSTETVTTVEEVTRYPAWVIFGMIVYVAIPMLAVVIPDFKNRPRRASGPGGIVVVQDWDTDQRK